METPICHLEIGGNHGFMAHIKDSEGNTFGIWSMK